MKLIITISGRGGRDGWNNGELPEGLSGIYLPTEK
jgi:hypothetical protein